MKKPRLVLIGERDLGKVAHQGIEASLALYQRDGDCCFDYDWACTATITPESLADIFRDATAVWCIPGSPYESLSGALLAIRFARTEKKAFLGTCGGFQHGLMEFFQNVLLRPAEHQESNPEAESPLIAKLSCSLVGAKGKVIVSLPDRFSDILGASESIEEFNCNYGINSDLANSFRGSDLEFVAHDENGAATQRGI